MEGWLSGRRQRFAKPSIVLKAVQGFESLIFHQFLVSSYSGYYTGLSSRISGFDSPRDRQVLYPIEK